MGNGLRAWMIGTALFMLTAGGAGAWAQGLPVVSYPDAIVAHNGSEAMAKRGDSGHFFVDAMVGSASVRMMVDTGAFSVSLRAEDAEKIGINSSSLIYSIQTTTGNGVGHAAPVVIPSLTVGGITQRNVQAVVMPPGKLFVSLLGQSFLAHLAAFKVEGDLMVLQGK